MSKQFFHTTFLIVCFCVGIVAQTPQSSCPKISIETPKGMLLPKQPGTFKANVVGPQGDGKLTFIWASTLGEIKGEYGSPTMLLQTGKKDGGRNVTVFVRVEGLPEGCPDSVSDLVSTVATIEGDPVDEISTKNLYDVRARMDNFFISVSSNAPYTGLINLYFSTKESRAARLARISNILSAIRFRKYDISKVEFAFIESDRSRTVLWLIPPNYDLGDMLESNPGAVFIKGPSVMKDPKKALPKQQCLCKWN